MNQPFSRISNKVIELYDSRNILKSLVTKELFGNYRSSLLGFGWHFMMPLLMMLIYYGVFNNNPLVYIPDFWVYLGCGLFPFTFMISSLTSSTSIILNGSGMIKKMFFPREILVIAKIISSSIVLIIGYIIVIILIIITGHNLNITSLSLSFCFIIIVCIFALGYSLFFSAITVYIRDIQHVIQSTSIAFFFITPMYFTIDSITGIFSSVIKINPFTYFVELFHQCIYYGSIPDLKLIIVCGTLSILSLFFGYYVFNKLKKGFAERL